MGVEDCTCYLREPLDFFSWSRCPYPPSYFLPQDFVYLLPQPSVYCSRAYNISLPDRTAARQ